MSCPENSTTFSVTPSHSFISIFRQHFRLFHHHLYVHALHHVLVTKINCSLSHHSFNWYYSNNLAFVRYYAFNLLMKVILFTSDTVTQIVSSSATTFSVHWFTILLFTLYTYNLYHFFNLILLILLCFKSLNSLLSLFHIWHFSYDYFIIFISCFTSFPFLVSLHFLMFLILPYTPSSWPLQVLSPQYPLYLGPMLVPQTSQSHTS